MSDQEGGYVNDEEIQEMYQPDEEITLDDAEGEGFQGEEIEIEEDPNGDDGPDDMEEEIPNDAVMGFLGHTDSVYCVAISPTNQDLAATGGGDDRAFIWKISTGEKLFELTGHKDSIIAIAFSENGKFLATAGMDGAVKVWDPETGKLTANLEGPDEVIWMHWHPRGNIVLAGSQDGSCWMWAANGQVMQVFSGHTAPVACGGFSPDGKLVVTGSEDSTIIVWDPKTASPIHKFTPADSRLNQGPITAIGFNPDSTILVTGSADNSSKLLHLQNGKVIASFDKHTEGIESVGFSPVIPLLATASIDGKICLWDVATLRLRHILSHEDAVVKAVWHPTEPLLISCSMDKTIKVWDARSGACLKTLRGHVDPILDLTLSKDGKTIITTSDDHAAYVFKL